MNRNRQLSLVVSIVAVAILSSCTSDSDNADTTSTTFFTTSTTFFTTSTTFFTGLQSPCAFRTPGGQCVDLSDYVDGSDVIDAVEKFDELIDDYRSREASPTELNEAAIDLDKVLKRTSWTTRSEITRFLDDASVAKTAAKADEALRALCAALPNRYGC